MDFNLDYFNNGVAAGGSRNYDDKQYNAQGYPLAPTTPANGAQITTDYTNDNRNAYDYKDQARQAQLDTMGAYNTDNKIVMKDGYLIDKIPNSRADQMKQSAMAYADAYLSTRGDVGQAALAAGGAVNQMNAIAKRQDMIPQLEATGRYQSIDLEKWAQTGNTQDLLTNAGKWQNMGNGIETNTLTGESRQIPGYVQQQKLTQVRLGDRVALIDQNGNEVHSLATGTKPGTTPTGGATGGGIGLDDEEATNPAFKKDSNGQLLKLSGYNKDGTPRYTSANSKDIESYNSRENAGVPDANQELVSSDLNKLQALPDSEIDKFTGHIISRSETGQDAYAEAQGAGAKANLAASKRVSTQMGNSAIAAAKSAGASGINTEAEIKRFTAGVPQVRYSSPEDYKASLKEIQDYANKFRDQLIREKGGKGGSSTQHLSDEDLLKQYGGN